MESEVPRDQTPSYQLPPKPIQSHKRRTILIVGVVAILAVLIFALFSMRSLGLAMRTSSFFSILFLPTELRTATFLSDFAVTTEYIAKGQAYAKNKTDSVLVSETNSPNGRLYRANGISRVQADSKTLLATSTPLIGLSRSPDGLTVAYAAAKDPKMELTQLAITRQRIVPTMWNIQYQRSGEGGSILVYGPEGIAPFFIDENTIGYISTTGINVLDARTASTTQLVARSFKGAISTMQSPDRTLLGFLDPIAKKISIYRLSAHKAELVATINVAGRLATSYTLANDGLYSLKWSSLGTSIQKQRFTDSAPRTVGFLPRELKITRFLISSP